MFTTILDNKTSDDEIIMFNYIKVQKAKERLTSNRRRGKHMKKKPLMFFAEQAIENGDCLQYPVFHFSITGRLPSLNIERGEYVEARDYFLEEILKTYDWKKINIQFNRAIIYIIHYFDTPKTIDLDNLNKKPLIDAIRRTLLIPDDSYHHLSLMEEGFFDRKYNHLEIFVMPRKYLGDFIKKVEF